MLLFGGKLAFSFEFISFVRINSRVLGETCIHFFLVILTPVLELDRSFILTEK